MLKSRHHIVIYPIFKALARFLVKRNFKSVTINGEFTDNGKSVLVITNHISWWDGFWIMLLNLKVIKRKFHFMMLESQLMKHWYFQHAGGYSIKKNSRSILDSIHYTVELLREDRNMVFIFPQGQINSMHNNNIKFEKGIERIIKSAQPDTQVLFVANIIDYFSNAKPNLYIYIESFFAKQFPAFTIEQEYNKFYTRVLQTQKMKVS